MLWYNNLVPLLLPFLLISGFFLSMIDWEHPNRAGCLILLFLCGLFCGYPVAQLPQEVLLFLAAVIFKQLLSQMPVTSM